MAAQPLATSWLRGIVISTVAAAAAYLATVLWVGHLEVAEAIKRVSVDTLIGLLGLSATNYGLRFFRWHFYLRALGSTLPLADDLRIYVGGFALTTTPGKAGEMARSLWLRPYGIPARTSLAAFLTERLQDFLVIILLSSLGASLYDGARWLVLAGVGLSLLAFILLYAPIDQWLLQAHTGGRRGRLIAWAQRLSGILVLARECLTPARFGLGFLIGVGAWGAEALELYLLMHALAHPLPFSMAASIYAGSMLAGAISFLPGGLGGSEASMILLLTIASVPLPIAVSATLLIRLATLWFAVLLGIIALAIHGRMPAGSLASPRAKSA